MGIWWCIILVVVGFCVGFGDVPRALVWVALGLTTAAEFCQYLRAEFWKAARSK